MRDNLLRKEAVAGKGGDFCIREQELDAASGRFLTTLSITLLLPFGQVPGVDQFLGVIKTVDNARKDILDDSPGIEEPGTVKGTRNACEAREISNAVQGFKVVQVAMLRESTSLVS